MVVNIGVQTVVALPIAVLMHRLTQLVAAARHRARRPYLVSNVVAGIVWLWILDTQLGIGNEIIEALGFDRIAFLADDAWAIPTIALINVWRHVGYTALLIFAGLQSIPDGLRGRRAWTARASGGCSGGSPCRCCGRCSRSC